MVDVADLDVNLALETYGANSLCIGQGRSWSRRTDGNVATAGNWGSGCYKVNNCCYSNGYIARVLHLREHPSVLLTENLHADTQSEVKCL